MTAQLVLGPLLRYVDETRATVWVETSAPCTVEVLGSETVTFSVAGHHYGLALVEGLEPGTTTPYEVTLDRRRVWPANPEWPVSVIRTPAPGERVRVVFGSCLAAAPQEPPFSLTEREHHQGLGPDALHAMALEVRAVPVEERPHALLLLGDQVYADTAAPDTRRFIRERRDISRPPGDSVADFEEYTRLYQETWSDPAVRWLLSTVSTSMIFDDHDIIDDWNISESWVHEIRREPWWLDRVTGGLMAYWLYQHLGNLPPEELAANDVLAALRSGEDGEPLLRDFAERADRGTTGTEGARWSYRRDLGRLRVIVIDSRNGRVLRGDQRSMLDEAEWAWLEDQARGDFDHLVLATSLPFLLPPGIHAVESWSEAICAGRWGRLAGRACETLRRAADLEHWAAFGNSFRRLTRLVDEVSSGVAGPAPAAVLVLSGDVHYSYLARATVDPAGGPERSPVLQITASPMRYPVPSALRRAFAYGTSRPGRWTGRALAATARLSRPRMEWTVERGPWFDNSIATLDVEPQRVRLRFAQARTGEGGVPRLETVCDDELV